MVGHLRTFAVLGMVCLTQASLASPGKYAPGKYAPNQKLEFSKKDLEAFAKAGKHPHSSSIDQLKDAVVEVHTTAPTMSADEVAVLTEAADANREAKKNFLQRNKPWLNGSQLNEVLGIADTAAEGFGIDTLIKIGEKVWQLIEAGKPSANITSKQIHVVPVAQQDWTKMENWQIPQTCKFDLQLKNVFGWTMIRHSYLITYNYGGQVDGHGKYLANVSVLPDANVSLFFNLESSVEFGEPVNTGSKEDPVAGIPVRIHWRAWQVPTKFQDRLGTVSAFIRADGTCSQIQ